MSLFSYPVPLNEIYRYGDGSTALVKITSLHRPANGYHGTQCMGGGIFVSHSDLMKASSADLKQWSDCAKWRKPEPQVTAWCPEPNAHWQRRLGKTLEETGELSAVLARCMIQGVDAIDPSSGKTNRQRLTEEIADVHAQLTCTIASLNLNGDAIFERSSHKQTAMATWEKLLEDTK